MAKPDLIGVYLGTTSNWDRIPANGVRTTSAFDVATGDLLVVFSGDENGGVISISNNGAALTWTTHANIGTALSTATVVAWSTTLASARTGLTVTSTDSSTGSATGIIVYHYRNHGGVGAVASRLGVSGVSSTVDLTVPGVVKNSAVNWLVGDWSAAVNASPTYRTADAGAITQRVNTTITGGWTAIGGDHADAGAAGAKHVGFTQSADWTMVAVEVLGLPDAPVYPTDIGFGLSDQFGPFGVDTGFPFVPDTFPPTVGGIPVTFNMGSVNAVLTLSGIVAQALARPAPGAAVMNFTGIVPTKEQSIVKPPVAVQTWTAQVPTKLVVREPFSPVATINFVGIVGTPLGVPVIFNMGTTQAIMNLSGIVPTKLFVRANSAFASLSLTALPPVDRFLVHPIVAPFNLSATVPAPVIRSAVMPQASLSLTAQVPQRPIIKVSAPTALLRFTATPPTDSTASPFKQLLHKALDKARSSSSSDQISR